MTTCVDKLQQLELDVLHDALAQCTPQQQALFARAFGPPASISLCRRYAAIRFLDRFLQENEKSLENPLVETREPFRLGTRVWHPKYLEPWFVAGYTPTGELILIQTIIVSDSPNWQPVK